MNPTLIEIIKTYINRKGITQEWLAGQVNVGTNTMSSWLNGETSPKLSQFMKMCELLNVKFHLEFPKDKFTVLGNIVRHNETPEFYTEIKQKVALPPFVWDENENRKPLEVADNVDIHALLAEARDFFLKQ